MVKGKVATMLSIPLLKHSIKSNYKILIIFAAVLAMYMSIMLSMYDSQTQEKMTALMAMMPEGLMSAMGMSTFDSSLVGFLASYYYGFIIIVFPMIFDIIIANKLVAKQVDRGSMAYLLSTPNKRTKIVSTQAGFLLISITLLISFVVALGSVLSHSMFPDELDITKFIIMNLGALLLHFAISGIAFFSSCLFNDTKNSLGLGAGLPITFFLIQMIANAGDKFADLKYATIFTLFNPEDVVKGSENVLSCFLALGVISIILYVGGVLVFKKRDLPL